MKRITILLAVVFLALAAGCSKPEATSAPQATLPGSETSAVQQPTDVGQPTGSAQVNPTAGPALEGTPTSAETTPEQPIDPVSGAPQFNDAEALQSLNSFRSRILSRTEIQGSGPKEMMLLQDETHNPQTQFYLMQDTTTDELNTLEMYTAGGFQYLNVGDGWMITQIDPADEDSGVFGETGVLSFADISQSTQESAYEYVGQENRNGINTSHYRLNMTAEQVLSLAESLTEITEYNAELWVANQPDLPVFTVYFLVQINGNAGDAPASFTMTQEVYDINQAFTIAVPSEAVNSGLPPDVPAYPNATQFSAMEGFISFSALDDIAMVRAFYENSLTSNGWSASDVTDLDNMVILTWMKDNRTLELSLSNREGGGSEVMMMIGTMEEEE